MDDVGVVSERPRGEPLLLLDEEFGERLVEGRPPSCPRHRLYPLSARSRHGDHVRVRPPVVARIFEHEAEAPTFVWFECVADLVPCQKAAIDNDVVRTTALTLAAPDEPACDVVVSLQPAGSVRVRLQLLVGNAIRGASSHGLHERLHVGVVRAEHREVIAVVRIGDPGLLELDDDPRRGTPDTELEAALAPVWAWQVRWWRRFGQLGVPGDAGDAAIGAPVTQRCASKRHPGVGRATLRARSTGHTSTLWEESRTDGEPRGDGSGSKGGKFGPPLSLRLTLHVVHRRRVVRPEHRDERTVEVRCRASLPRPMRRALRRDARAGPRSPRPAL